MTSTGPDWAARCCVLISSRADRCSYAAYVGIVGMFMTCRPDVTGHEHSRPELGGQQRRDSRGGTPPSGGLGGLRGCRSDLQQQAATGAGGAGEIGGTVQESGGAGVCVSVAGARLQCLLAHDLGVLGAERP